MIPAQFDYVAPATVEEAVTALAQGGEDAKVLAGGQSLLPVLRMRMADPGLLVDLGRIEELRGVQEDGDAVVIGAMTTHHDVIRDPLVNQHLPLLALATRTVADPQVRHRGTFGGSLKDVPAHELAATVIRALVERTNLPPDSVDDVVLGHCYPTMDAPAIGRVAALDAGLPVTVPGLQINRRCGSGLQAVLYAAMQVPVGVMLDRFGSRAMLLSGLALMTAGQLFFAFTTSFGGAVLARAVLGAGDAMIFVSVIRLVTVWFLVRQAPMVTQVTGLTGQLGAIAAAGPLSYLLHALGWTRAFALTSSVGVVLLVAVLVLVKDSPYRRSDVVAIKLRALAQ